MPFRKQIPSPCLRQTNASAAHPPYVRASCYYIFSPLLLFGTDHTMTPMKEEQARNARKMPKDTTAPISRHISIRFRNGLRSKRRKIHATKTTTTKKDARPVQPTCEPKKAEDDKRYSGPHSDWPRSRLSDWRPRQRGASKSNPRGDTGPD